MLVVANFLCTCSCCGLSDIASTNPENCSIKSPHQLCSSTIIKSPLRGVSHQIPRDICFPGPSVADLNFDPNLSLHRAIGGAEVVHPGEVAKYPYTHSLISRSAMHLPWATWVSHFSFCFYIYISFIMLLYNTLKGFLHTYFSHGGFFFGLKKSKKFVAFYEFFCGFFCSK